MPRPPRAGIQAAAPTVAPLTMATIPRSLFLLLLLPVVSAMATEQAFPPTTPGTSEVKTLPAGVLLKSTGQGNYFEQSDGLFMPLFRYISRHNIAMTTPVEAQIDSAAMYFWVAESQHAKVAGSEGAVEVQRIPERKVASRGAKGSYSQKNFEKTRAELQAWIARQPELESHGEPYAVFWHGPFTPWFAKRYEVHIPLRARPPAGD
jgi:effector-binding domain-containing protein